MHGFYRVVRMRSPWPRRFLRDAGRLAGARVTIRGVPQTANVLFVSNHLSWLDILIVAGTTGSAFVARADMAPWPVIGWLASLNRSVYVARERRSTVDAQAAAIRAALANGQPLTLFPEGTPANGLALLPFRSALLAAVASPPAGIAIQPVAIDYGRCAAEIAWIDDESFGKNALRILAKRDAIDVTIHFLEPLGDESVSDRKVMTAQCQAAIAAALGLA